MGGEAGSAAAVGSEGRVKNLGLVFEDERKGCYSSGETVAGHVLLEAAEPVALRALRLEAQGRATAAWGPSAGVSAATPAAASEVEYLNVRLSLQEPPAGEGIILLQPGKHEFPFRFQLPSEPLVTSFTGKYGSIQYCVRAVLERPKVPDQSVKRELQVVSHIDVNTPALLIRVDYSLAVYIHIPGAKKLMIELPLVIGTIPYNGFGSRNSSVASQFSMDMSWLTLTLPEQPEAPPNYADVVSEEEFSRHIPPYPQPSNCEEEVCCPMFACIPEFRFQPPPLYSEVDPHPSDVEETQPVSFIL
uniref:Arrestin domain containing 4 n=1 Tax=Propithecus coquereli TaxID=379532 RepID=A0A2K6GTE9_PROCO